MSAEVMHRGAKVIAYRLGRSPKTIQRWFNADKLSGAYRVGRTSPITMSEADVQKFLAGAGKNAGQ
jgi:hypothetical protein